ncbi:hypothetical protein Pla108_11720 [Botrimarina colliarenosi]|uniref:C2H2-type domain-containing protein n=1 Tax=Botrimarina colliarenosi TaxID=2528001 RepID=A0A5C6AJK0_9BACT|nr:hypothetical protein Pla108_11720 [Botrimarina colliarenosi]
MDRWTLRRGSHEVATNNDREMSRTCPRCQLAIKTRTGMHWHLRRDHGLSKEQAYRLVGKSFTASIGSTATSSESASSTESDVRSERAA